MDHNTSSITNEEMTMIDEVVEGLSHSPKYLPTKYLYDEKGSQLFDEICELADYYPTRTEIGIMQNNIYEICDYVGYNSQLVEFGSGSSLKTRILLEEMPDITYVPVEISADYLDNSVQELRKQFPDLEIKPVRADYTKPFTLPEIQDKHARRVIYFPGSTIGNFRPEDARQFLNLMADEAGDDGGLLIGVDLKKDPKILLQAYNDDEGVTAEFSKNLLTHINRELNADFVLDCFRHEVCYDERKGRIEIYLRCIKDHQVTLGEYKFNFKEGECIHTENSYKYTLDSFAELASDYFVPRKIWKDEKEWFSIQYMEVK